jgi:hypothetical protein
LPPSITNPGPLDDQTALDQAPEQCLRHLLALAAALDHPEHLLAPGGVDAESRQEDVLSHLHPVEHEDREVVSPERPAQEGLDRPCRPGHEAPRHVGAADARLLERHRRSGCPWWY